jgi:hypothetical protein
MFNDDRVDESTLERLAAARGRHPSLYEKDTSESDFLKRDDGHVSRFVVVKHLDVRVGARLNLIRSLDGHSYDGYEGPSVPIRSPQLMAFAERYGQQLEDEVKRRRESSATSNDETVE